MKSRLLNILKLFCLLIFIIISIAFFYLENTIPKTYSVITQIENILRTLNSFSIYIIPIIFLIYFQRNEKNKYLWSFVFIIFWFYYIFLFFLVAYLSITENFFDIDFFLNNFHEAFFTASSIFSDFGILFVVVFCLAFLVFFLISINLFQKQFQVSKRSLRNVLIIFCVFFLISGSIQFYFKYEKGLLLDFVNTFFLHGDPVYKKYTKDYEFIVRKYSNFNLNEFSLGDKNNNFPDIYFIHLESINGDLNNKYILPNFENYSSNYGINFINFYSNSTQTLLSEESILCALPPSINGYFQYKYNAQNLICLPKILGKFGYKTFLFKSHSLEFAKAGKFLLNTGFNEVHNKDIMKTGDISYKWGFREDGFYKRVSEYLENYKNEQKFVYIAVSTTNHYPFIIHEKSTDLPIQNPKSMIDDMKNTVYIQDKYLLNVLEEIKKDNREKYIFIFSDHAWPLNYHRGNILNQSRGYKENFYIPFAFVYFGENGKNFKIGENVSNLYNQIDFLKTTLDLLNIKTNNNYLGNSFYCELFKDSTDCNVNNCSMSVQQYSDKYITLFFDNKHYIYNVKKKQAYYFDSLNDKYEKNQKNITQLEFLKFYERCKNLIGY